VSYPWAVRSGGNAPWRYEPSCVAKRLDDLWIGVKC
jgi:hypothetical protein